MSEKRPRYIILYLSTESKNEAAKKEYAVLKNILGVSNNNDTFKLLDHVEKINNKILLQSIDEAHKKLNKGEKLIIHYCGHSCYFGAELEGVEPNEKDHKLITPNNIRNFFNQFVDIECVLFASCDSEEISKAVIELEHITFSIYYPDLLHDSESIFFSENFYEGLLRNNFSYELAYLYFKAGACTLNKSTENFKKFPQEPSEPKFPYSIHKNDIRSNDDKLDRLIELAVQISRINKSSNYDLLLFNLIEKAKNDIQIIDKNSKVRFSDFVGLNIKGKLDIGKEIRIFKLQKRLIFEYVYLVTDTIYNLIGKTKEVYLLEKIKMLIKNLNLAITFNINGDTEGEFYILIDKKINEIHSFLNDTEIKNIELYIKLHDFISKLTTFDFGTIETSIKNYEFDNSNKIDDISSAIQMIKEKHNELKNEFKEPLIPIKFTSSWN